MPTIALIGPDGAGKTTIARMLEGSGVLPLKYLYMGINVSSSNLVLPTSRLVERVKPLINRWAPASRPPGGPASGAPAGGRSTRGRLWAAARLANRLAEEWFRQLVSWGYQLRGYAVLYDRHFVFDFCPEVAGGRAEPLGKRVHRQLLSRFYPRPDLVIFLDAPGEALFARKGESTPAELERRRQAFLRQGEMVPGFVRVDATRPLEAVYDEVARHVVRFCRDRRLRAGDE